MAIPPLLGRCWAIWLERRAKFEREFLGPMPEAIEITFADLAPYSFNHALAEAALGFPAALVALLASGEPLTASDRRGLADLVDGSLGRMMRSNVGGRTKNKLAQNVGALAREFFEFWLSNEEAAGRGCYGLFDGMKDVALDRVIEELFPQCSDDDRQQARSLMDRPSRAKGEGRLRRPGRFDH